MKKILLIIPSLFLLSSCALQQRQDRRSFDPTGNYVLKSDKLYQALSTMNYSRLELHKDGTYTLSKAAVTFSPVIEQCDYASKGRWSFVGEKVIEITSENYYTKQNGFAYEIRKEKKLSQDSLYINVIFPTDFHPVTLNFTFNNRLHHSITTRKKYIVISKSDYFGDKPTPITTIHFDLNAIVSGRRIYKSRILFEIFEEEINTDEYNYLSIVLPNFDRCFFEFEPYHQELIYIKNRNQLLWQGEIWEK